MHYIFIIAITYLNVIVSLVALIFLLILIILYGIRKIKIMKQPLIAYSSEDEKQLYQVFLYLREEIAKIVATLDGQSKLSKREAKLLEALKQLIDTVEKKVIEIITKKQSKPR